MVNTRGREKPCDDSPEAVGRMGGRAESVNMMSGRGPLTRPLIREIVTDTVRVASEHFLQTKGTM